MLQKIKERPIVFVALLVTVLAAVVVVVYQQRFGPTLDPNSPLSQEVSAAEFAAKTMAVTGAITDVDSTEYSLTIKASIFDLAGVGEQVIPATLPSKEVVYRVIVDDLTVFEGKKGLQELVVGDEVTIVSETSIYEAINGDIRAERVVFLNKEISAKQAVMGYQDVLIGFVRSISKEQGATTLFVEAEIPDAEKLSGIDPSGSFEVPYVTKRFAVMVPVGVDVSSVKSGRMVRIETEENIYEATSLTAKAVSVME